MEKKNILVVDDKEDLREAVTAILCGKGYDVKAVSSGPAALEIFAKEPFDLVISDFKMPQMNGVELLENVKRIDSDVPFVIMTAFGEKETQKAAMDKGAFTFLDKDNFLFYMIESVAAVALHTRNIILQNKALVSEIRALKGELSDKWDYVGNAPKIMEVRNFTNTVASSRSTVLITA